MLPVELLLALECCYHSLKPAPVGGQSRRHWKSIPHLGHAWKVRSEVEAGYSTPPFRTAIWYCLILIGGKWPEEKADQREWSQ